MPRCYRLRVNPLLRALLKDRWWALPLIGLALLLLIGLVALSMSNYVAPFEYAQ